MNEQTAPSQGGLLIGVEGQVLPLRSVAVSARAAGGLARVELRQTFGNVYAEPLRVTYMFPLPAGAATAAYEIHIGERVIRGEIDRWAAARERFEQALASGHTAGLLDQTRASVFTQSVGNVPPGAEVTVVMTLDQPLAWIADGCWEWRFPTVVAPRYMGAEGRVPDAQRLTADVGDGDTRVRAGFVLVIEDAIMGGAIESPSHRIAVTGGEVQLDAAGARLDRDIVVRWPVALPQPGIEVRTSRPANGRPRANSAYGLLTIVPPAVTGAVLARDLIVLLDTSGSMGGAPLRHAQEAVLGLIDSLTEDDSLELVAFSDRPERWRRESAQATKETKLAAADWVRALEAGGGTEMTHAVVAALEPLRPDSQRQVVLVTDGQIGFEHEVVRAINDRLPAASRLHAVGVGSATNQGFLHAAARAGRGSEIQFGLEESPAAAASRIVATTRGPAVVDIVIEGEAVEACAPRRTADLMAGSPVRVGLKLKAAGGEIVVRGRTAEGPWEARLSVPPTTFGDGDPAVAALYAREAVEDLELDLACGAKREVVDPQVERIGLDFGIATRMTAWVAVDKQPSVDPREPMRVERMPQELPFGMSAEGLGLRRAASAPLAFDAPDVLARYSLERKVRMLVAPASEARREGLLDRIRSLMHSALRRLRESISEASAHLTPLRELVYGLDRADREVSERLREIENAFGDLSARIRDGGDATAQDTRGAMKRLHEVNHMLAQVRDRWLQSHAMLEQGAETARHLQHTIHAALERQEEIQSQIDALRRSLDVPANARIITTRGTLSVIPGAVLVEFRMPGGFEMPELERVRIIRHDRNESEFEVDRRRTTRPGLITAGVVSRIGLIAGPAEIDDASYLALQPECKLVFDKGGDGSVEVRILLGPAGGSAGDL